MKVHFTSIGGSVMHQLAIALKRKGYEISGTDDEIFEPSKTNLEKEGLLPKDTQWHPELVTNDLEAVILGMHAKNDNPELIEAKKKGLNIYSFPEYIYQESKSKTRVVVGGSHGKTTTTAMIMHVLKIAKKNFDYLVGANIAGFEQSVRITDAPIIICEGDEYPASAIQKKPKFHFLFPHIAIITGIAWDHINVFPTFDFYLEQFTIFISKIEPNGVLIYNETDEVLSNLLNKNRRTDITYQPYNIPEHSIKEGQTSVTLENETGQLKVFGNHNLLNLHAAFYACRQLGVEASEFIKAINSFTGASKRLELMSSSGRCNFYRDFAHAPSKVKATIEAVKQQYPERKLIAVLELHTFSSLNEQFMKEYAGSLDKADLAVVFYSRHALELKRMPDLNKRVVEEGFEKKNLEVVNNKDSLWQWLQAQDYDFTNVIFMSSGNYDGLNIQQLANDNTSRALAS